MFYVNASTSASNTKSAPIKTTCRAWEQSRCSRGAYCRYLHSASPFSSPVSLSSSISEPSAFTEANSSLNMYSDSNDDLSNAFDQLSLNNQFSTSKNMLNTSLNRMNNNLHSSSTENALHDIHSHSVLSNDTNFSIPSFTSSQFNMAKKDCWDWLSGRCTRGGSCKYAHSKGGTTDLDELQNAYTESPVQYMTNHTSIMTTPPRRASFDSEVDSVRKAKQTPLSFTSASLGNELMQTTDEDVEVCRFYAKHGRCKYGTTCKFIHIHPSLQTPAFLSSHFSFNQLLQAGFIDRDGNFTSLHQHSHAHHINSAPTSLVSSPGSISASNHQSSNSFSSLNNVIGGSNSLSSQHSSFPSLQSRTMSSQMSSPVRTSLPSGYSPLANGSSPFGVNSKYLNNYHDSGSGPINDPFPVFNSHISQSNKQSGSQFSGEQTPPRKGSGHFGTLYADYNQQFESHPYDSHFDSFFGKDIDNDNEESDAIIQKSTPPLHSFLSISITQSPSQSQANSPTSPATYTSFYSHDVLGSQTERISI